MNSTPSQPSQGLDWAASVAMACCTHSPLPPDASESLRMAFGNCDVVLIALANGDDQDALDAFFLSPTPTTPLTPRPFVSAKASSGVRRALLSNAIVQVDDSSEDREELADWQQLHAAVGIRWMLVAPLTCASDVPHRLQHYQPHRVLGAVVAGGRGPAPSVDSSWLREWGCEMGGLISHISIQLMECSLEMLSAIFPPRVLEQLVINAASRTGQCDLASALREAYQSQGGSSTRSLGSAGLPTGSSSAGGGSSQAAGSAAGSGRSSAEGRPPRPMGAMHRQLKLTSTGKGSQVISAPSPFAVQAGYDVGSPLAPPSPDPGMPADVERQDSPGQAPQEGSALLPQASSNAAAALLREASRGSAASAILRQVSMRSEMSRLMEERLMSPTSPHNWEVEGYEDILEEDQRSNQERRPSMTPERAQSAQSRAAASLDQTIRAAVEEAANRAADRAAAEPHSLNNLFAAMANAPEPAGGAHDRDSSREEVTVGEPGSPGGGVTTTGLPPAQAPDEPPRKSRCSIEMDGESPSQQEVAGLRKRGVASTGTGGSSYAAAPGVALALQSAAGAGVPPSALRQAWDRTFVSPVLEASYRAWLQPYLLRSDASLGFVHFAAVVAACARIAMYGLTASSLLSLAGVLLMTAPAVPALVAPSWWASRRTAALAVLRLAAASLVAALLACSRSPNPLEERALSWQQALLGHSGAAALCLLPLRLPLPFHLHLPLHLVCLWIVTAGASLTHMCPLRSAASGASPWTSLPATMLAQLVVGFLLSSLFVFWREQRLRASFLGSRRAAACLRPRTAKGASAVAST